MENPPVPEHLRNGPHGNAPPAPSPPQEQNQEEGNQLINADRRLIIQRFVWFENQPFNASVRQSIAIMNIQHPI